MIQKTLNNSYYPVAFNAFGMLLSYSFANHPPDMHVHVMIKMMRGRQVTVIYGVT